MENEMFESLKQVIKQTINISEGDLDYCVSYFNPVYLKKDDNFVAFGQRCSSIAFVYNGLLRTVTKSDNGDESTCHFSTAHSFVTSFYSFNAQMPSKENISALVDSQILVIGKADLEYLYAKYPVMQEFGRKTAEAISQIMENRLYQFLNLTADERYQLLLSKQSHLLKIVPVQILASYIGITPQHMSRLRRKI